MPAQPPPDTASRDGHARRAPRQERSQQTLELLFEAALRALDRVGFEGLTTTVVAEEAGVSVGSVYRYFHDKDTLLLALAQREMERSAEEVRRAVERARRQGKAGAEAAVQALFASLGGRHRVRRLLIDAAARAGRSDLLLTALSHIEPLLTDAKDGGMSPTGAFVLTAAVVGVLRASLARDRDPARDAVLHDELVRLVRAYRQACREAQHPASPRSSR